MVSWAEGWVLGWWVVRRVVRRVVRWVVSSEMGLGVDTNSRAMPFVEVG